jgi:hypothetical protein
MGMIVQEFSELVEETAAEKISGSCHFLSHIMIVPLLLRGCFEPLPQQCTTEEVNEEVGK